MKRTICLLLTMLMIFCLAACKANPTASSGESKATEYPIGDNTRPEETKAPTETEDTEPTEEMVETRIGKDVYFAYPKEWLLSSGSQSYIVYQSDECAVGVSYDWFNSFEGELGDLIAFLDEAFTSDVNSHSKGYIYGEQIVTTKTENCTIGDNEAVRFEGTINNQNEWSCHVYGYVLIVNNVRLMVAGTVTQKAQDAGMIAEINALTDQIAESVYVKG